MRADMMQDNDFSLKMRADRSEDTDKKSAAEQNTSISSDALKERLKSLQALERYPIMRAGEFARQKAASYRKILFGINLPLVVGIPAMLESGLLEACVGGGAKYLSLYKVLTLADCMLFCNSWILYSLLTKIVLEIDYLPASNKFEFRHLNSAFLKETTTAYDAQ